MDQTLLTFFNQTLAHPLLDAVMVIITYAGLALLPGLVIVLLWRKQYRLGATLLAAMAGSLLLTCIFQYLAFRPRPELVRLVIPTPNFPAYPSGHATLAFAVALVLGLTLRRGYGWVLALTGAGLIALSRVYLGVHYPSDMIGGAILGAGVGALSYGLLMASSLRQPDWRWFLWPQIAIMAIISQMAYLDLLRFHFLMLAPIDKILHFVLFGLAVFWLNLWLEGRTVRWGRWLIPLALVIALLIASSEEIAQAWSPVRTSSLSDWSSDLAGMLFFWWLSQKLLKSKISRPTTAISGNPAG